MSCLIIYNIDEIEMKYILSHRYQSSYVVFVNDWQYDNKKNI